MSTNGGPWTLWTTVPAASPSAVFHGRSNTTYAFSSMAHDQAGNTERQSPAIEASTYLPDLTPPVTWVNPAAGIHPSSVDPSTGTFTLQVTGTAPGGGPLAYFEVFVAIDLGDGGNTRRIGAAIPAGFPDPNGVYHATITYQGLTDGVSHSYTFSSLGISTAGLVQPSPINPVAFPDQAFTAGSLQVTDLIVQHGASERSFVRYLAINFNESDVQSGGRLAAIAGSLRTASPAVRLSEYDLNGTAASNTSVSLAGITATVVDHAIELDFGLTGLGGSANTTAGDGYYELEVTVGGESYRRSFYRLLGDVTGDGVVDDHDLTAIASEMALSSSTGYAPLSGDVNGDELVTALDQVLATRAKGRRLRSGLRLG